MRILEDIKEVLGMARATKSNIVSGLLKKGQITAYEASILLEGSLIVTIESVEVSVSSGARIIGGDDMTTERKL